MPLYAIIRSASILAYFFIFLKGQMILLPFGLLLFTGLFEGESLTRILIFFADISLIILLIFSFGEKTKKKLFIEIVIYLILLAPLIKIFVSFPFEMFNYFLFVFPSICFILLYPLSIFLAYKQINKLKTL